MTQSEQKNGPRLSDIDIRSSAQKIAVYLNFVKSNRLSSVIYLIQEIYFFSYLISNTKGLIMLLYEWMKKIKLLQH